MTQHPRGEMDEIPDEYLRARYAYDPDSGQMTWKPRPREDFCDDRTFGNWNTRFAGKAAFYRRSQDGYLIGELCYLGQRRFLLGHRVAFAIHNGRHAAGEVDHINGDRADNRAANLRDVTRTQNIWNTRKRGKYLPGVRASGSRFVASISLGGGSRHLGTFDTEEAAHLEYVRQAVAARGGFVPSEIAAAIRKGPTP